MVRHEGSGRVGAKVGLDVVGFALGDDVGAPLVGLCVP